MGVVLIIYRILQILARISSIIILNILALSYIFMGFDL